MPRVSPMTPALATEYGVLLNVPPPRWAETDDRLTMRPYPCWTIDCAARRLAKCTPSRLMLRTRCHSPSGRSRYSCAEETPARFTSAAIGGSAASMVSNAARTAPSSATFAPAPTAWTPCCSRSSAATCSLAAWSRSMMPTFQPCSARWWAAARPIPRGDAAPVRTTVCCSLRIVVSSVDRGRAELVEELLHGDVGLVPVGDELRRAVSRDVEVPAPDFVPSSPASTCCCSDGGVANRSGQRVCSDSKQKAYTSRPAMSAIANGPKNGRRKPKVVRTMVSMSSGLAMPSSAIFVASSNRAYCRRLRTNPVESFTRADCLPVAATTVSPTSIACSFVVGCGMSSTPGMNGAGFEKCTPRNRSGPVTASASDSMRIVEVFEPITASGRAASLIRRSVACLISSFSGTASSMKSAVATASSMESAAPRWASTRATASAGNRPSATNCSVSAMSRAGWPRRSRRRRPRSGRCGRRGPGPGRSRRPCSRTRRRRCRGCSSSCSLLRRPTTEVARTDRMYCWLVAQTPRLSPPYCSVMTMPRNPSATASRSTCR